MGGTCGTYGDVGKPKVYKVFRRRTCGWDTVVKYTLSNQVCKVWTDKIAWDVEKWRAVVDEFM